MIFCILFLTFFFIFFAILFYSNSPLFFKEDQETEVQTNPKDCFCEEVKPVYLENKNTKAIIFVHGFPSSPAECRKILGDFHKHNFDVFAPLLPGFGTTPELFVKTNFSQWYNYLKKFYLEKRKKYKKLYVVGVSMGGSLTLKLAEEFSGTENSPNAIITAAAPAFLNKFKFGIFRQPGFFLIKFISLFAKSINPGLDIGGEAKKERDGDEDWRGYKGVFPKQTYSLYMNLKVIEKDLKKITAPAFLVHSKKDKTVPFKNLFYIAEKINSKNLVTEVIDTYDFSHNHHCLFIYNSLKESLVKKILNFIERS